MKPKVLIIIDTQIIGGPGKGLFQFLRTAQRESFVGSFDYKLCTFEYNSPRSTDFIDTARSLNLSLHLLKQRRRFDLSSLKDAIRLVRSEAINLIQTHGYKEHLFGLAVSKICGIPWVSFSHGRTTEDFKVRLYHSLDNLTLRFPEISVGVSPIIVDSLKKLRGMKRVFHIPNAVDPNELKRDLGGDAMRSFLQIPSSTFLIGSFGRFSKEKGHAVLLKAASKLKGKDFKLILVGDGPEKKELFALANALGLENAFIVIPHTRTIRDYFEAIDLFVLPSYSEGLPNVVLEAMSLKKPVIASAVGAIPEVMQDGVTGWIVPPGDPDILAEKINTCYESREGLVKIGEAGYLSVVSRYDPVVRAESIVRLYYEALRIRSPGS